VAPKLLLFSFFLNLRNVYFLLLVNGDLANGEVVDRSTQRPEYAAFQVIKEEGKHT